MEEIVYATGLVGTAVALGVPHPRLGQAVVLVVTPPGGGRLDVDALRQSCQREMPQYMVPQLIVERAMLPRNANGKIDRKMLASEFATEFQ